MAVVSSRRLHGVYAELRRRGVAVEIVTATDHQDRAHDPAYALDVPYHYAAGRGLRAGLLGRGNRQLSARRKQSPWFGSLNRLRQSFPLLKWTDEGGPGYYQNALVRGRELLDTGRFSHLLSSYRPWVDHRVAAQLKREFPNVTWIADFRDLPLDPVRRDAGLFGLTKYQSKRARRIVAGAERLWAVSEGQARWLADLHPTVEVVYNGLDALPEPSMPPPTEFFTINYTGSYYPHLQDVRPLLRGLGGEIATSLVKINYVGKDGDAWRAALTAGSEVKLAIQSPLAQAEARKRQREAATNLLLSWSAPGYYGVLTAKLYDYLAAGRPITALVNGPDDPELRRIVEGSGAGRVFGRGQEGALRDWLHELYDRWQTGGGRFGWRTEPEALRGLQHAEQFTYLRP